MQNSLFFYFSYSQSVRVLRKSVAEKITKDKKIINKYIVSRLYQSNTVYKSNT